jgi:site-specific DNA-cytosine methylase
MNPTGGLRVLELYCGIGGCAAALAPPAAVGGPAAEPPPAAEGAPAAIRAPAAIEVAAAIDVNHLAVGVYRRNFPHPAVVRTLESFAAAELAAFAADLWWLSPPCQPFTRRGLGRDLDDPRAASLLALIDRAAEVRPRHLALENVPGFAGSRAHGRLRAALDGAGYEVRERLLCPTELGVPNRRRRFYLVASRGGSTEPAAPSRPRPLGRPGGRRGERAARPARDDSSAGGRATAAAGDRAAPPPSPLRRPLAAYLDPEPSPALHVDPTLLDRYAGALDLVDPADPGAVAACFTAAYGRSPVRSGSYLIVERGGGGRPRAVRRFSPAEILRLLGFPPDYALPAGLSLANAWRLAGNALSVAAVRAVLAAIPALAGGNYDQGWHS